MYSVQLAWRGPERTQRVKAASRELEGIFKCCKSAAKMS